MGAPSEGILLGPGGDFVLGVLAEIDEVVAVASDPDDQISVLLGIGLGLMKGLGIDHVELDVVTIEPEVRTDQQREF